MKTWLYIHIKFEDTIGIYPHSFKYYTLVDHFERSQNDNYSAGNFST